MTKMETLHSKQQNVLRRKMEEATALNKRLKDIMDKQKANSKFGKGAGASNTGVTQLNQITLKIPSVTQITQAREDWPARASGCGTGSTRRWTSS